MIHEYGNISMAKVVMHEACNEVLKLLRSEPADQLSYLLGRLDAYLMMSQTLGILNPDEVNELKAQRDAIPAMRSAIGLD